MSWSLYSLTFPNPSPARHCTTHRCSVGQDQELAPHGGSPPAVARWLAWRPQGKLREGPECLLCLPTGWESGLYQ